MPDLSSTRHLDAAIAGGGAVGLALACALRKFGPPGLRIGVLDPRFGASGRIEAMANRTSLVASGPCRLLRSLGLGDRLFSRSQPVFGMEISDSKLDDEIRMTRLRFDPDTDQKEPLGYLMAHGDLEPALENLTAELGIEVHTTRIEEFSRGPASVRLDTGAGAVLRASLVIGADGRNSAVREFAKIKSVNRDYNRSAIVATIGLETGHDGIAVQHFFPAGTFALLPMTGNRFSVVWVEQPDEARRLCEASQDIFVSELARRSGARWGNLQLLDRPKAFPLSLSIARKFFAERTILAGDAAHGVHPLAGQGLNLGLRDVALIVEALNDAALRGDDFGSAETGRHYEQRNRPGAVAMAGAIDMLFDIFSLQNSAARQFRSAGLAVVDKLPHLKTGMMQYAMGRDSTAPILFQ